MDGWAGPLVVGRPDREFGRTGLDGRSASELAEDASLRAKRNDTIDDCGFFEQFLAR